MSTILEPIALEQRIRMLDVTRGIAVLGILLMNITAFGLPYAYEDPTNWGGATGASFQVWRAVALFFEGTMRGLFTLLFGAGAFLFVQRHAARSPGLRPADLYYKRTLWLIAFGLVNGYLLLWPGDILFYYGLVGLVLFVFRRLPPKQLIAAASVAMLLQTTVTFLEWRGFREIASEAEQAQSAQLAGEMLSGEQHLALQRFAGLSERLKPSRSTLEWKVARVRESYSSAFEALAPETWQMQTELFLRHGLLESLGMMLLGMALLKLSVLTGEASTRLCVTLMIVGYALGLSVNWMETARLASTQFSIDAIISSYLTYDLGRIPMTLGHVGLIALLCRLPAARAALRPLASVGQMALTNYLGQSIICMLVFTGAGLAWFGQLERYQLYYIVGAIWAMQLVSSHAWLQRYRFGPAEWLWRSLTYGRRQPMRCEARAHAPEHT
jgi:uncharacterized protein